MSEPADRSTRPVHLAGGRMVGIVALERAPFGPRDDADLAVGLPIDGQRLACPEEAALPQGDPQLPVADPGLIDRGGIDVTILDEEERLALEGVPEPPR